MLQPSNVGNAHDSMCLLKTQVLLLSEHSLCNTACVTG